MLKVRQILDSGGARALVLAAGGVAFLAGCGQKGPLFLPTGEAAANRATLPQAINPGAAGPSAPSSSSAPGAPTPAIAPPDTGTGTGTANPIPRP